MRSTIPVSHLRALDGTIVWWDATYPWLEQGTFDRQGNLFAVAGNGDVIQINAEQPPRSRVVMKVHCKERRCIHLSAWNGNVFAFLQTENLLLVRDLNEVETMNTLTLPQGLEIVELLQIDDTSIVLSARESYPQENWQEVADAQTEFFRIGTAPNAMSESGSIEKVRPPGMRGPVLQFLGDATDPGGAWGIVVPGPCVSSNDLECRTTLGAAIVGLFADARAHEPVFTTRLDSLAAELHGARVIGMQNEQLCSWPVGGGSKICETNQKLPTTLTVFSEPYFGIVLGASNFVFSYSGEVGALRQRDTMRLPSCARVVQVNAFSTGRIFVGARPEVRMILTSSEQGLPCIGAK